MSEEKDIEVRKEEATAPEGVETIRTSRTYVPRTDIYEDDKKILVVADMPGVSDKDVDIMLEKKTLTIKGSAQSQVVEGASLIYSEYGVGDFERSFVVSTEIDREKIEAHMKDGVLTVSLPKAAVALARKITVNKG